MNINGIFLVDGPLDFPRVRARLAERLLAFDRFRSRVSGGGNGGALPPGEGGWSAPRWELDPDFELERHLVLEAPGQDLFELAGRLFVEPLDRAHPLWKMHVLDLGGRWALIARLHHAMGDGVALMHVISRLVDRPVATYRTPHGQSLAGWLARAGSLIGACAGLVREVLLRPEPVTRLKGPLGKVKRLVVSRPVSLDEVKAVGRRSGCTLNDILLSAVAGSLRAYLLAHGDPVPPDLQLRAVMPVDLRGPADQQLGNKFGLAFVSLPVGLEDPIARAREVHRRIERLKASPHPFVLYMILRLAGRLPVRAERFLVSLFGAHATAVVTNVPGPVETVELEGQPLRELMFWVPQSGRLGLGISLISYAGTIRIGVAADAGLIPRPELLLEGFERALLG